MREVRFPRVWPARAIASRTLPVTLQPTPPDTVPHPLPVFGGFATELPRSRRLIDRAAASGGRSFVSRTGDLLDTQGAPAPILRLTQGSDAGKIGVGAGPDGIGGWPYDGNALLIPHQSIPRRPITVTPFVRSIDTGVTIPSIAIGDPVR